MVIRLTLWVTTHHLTCNKVLFNKWWRPTLNQHYEYWNSIKVTPRNDPGISADTKKKFFPQIFCRARAVSSTVYWVHPIFVILLIIPWSSEECEPNILVEVKLFSTLFIAFIFIIIIFSFVFIFEFIFIFEEFGLIIMKTKVMNAHIIR